MTVAPADPADPAAPPPARHRRRRGAWIALAVVLALAALGAGFRWTWLRPAIRHYVMAHSGREIDFEDAHLHFHGLDPTVEVRGLRIANAPWAKRRDQPFIRAGRLAATISWRSLGSGMTVIELLSLEDAEVDMERLADGTRNWRLLHPDDRGPPHVRVLALEARRARLHTIHAGIGLEGDIATEPLAAAEALPGHPDLPLVQRLRFDGRWRGHAFSVDAAVSRVLVFGDPARRYALRGVARTGGLALHAAGTADDAHALGDFDVDAQLAGDGRGATWPLPDVVERAGPFSAQGHVAKTGDRWRATAVKATAGRGSWARGDVELAWSPRKRWVPGNAPLPPQPDPPPPPRVQARLDDAVLDLADLRAWRGAGEAAAPPSAVAPAPALSTTPLPLARLRAVDGELELRALRLVPAAGAPAPAWLPTHASAHATLARGRLDVPHFALQLDGGRLEGSARLDASTPPARLALDARAHGLALGALSPRLAQGGVDGRLDARATLQARGDSQRALVASAAGDVDVALAPGASVARKLDAKLSLDAGEWLRGLLDKSARVPVECAEVSLAVARGGATTRRFAVATAHTALAGRGSVDLLDETFELTLRPVRRGHALLALDKAIHASGPWHAPRIRLQAPPDDLQPQACTPSR